MRDIAFASPHTVRLKQDRMRWCRRRTSSGCCAGDGQQDEAEMMEKTQGKPPCERLAKVDAEVKLVLSPT
jgi:hypothetical protein